MATRPQSAPPRSANDDHFDLVHADALRYLPELLADLGVDADEVFAQAHLSVAMTGGTAALSFRSLVDLLILAAERTGCADVGMRLAERQRGGKVIGPVGVVMKNSETVGQALGYCARHIHAYSLATKVRFRPDRPNHVLFVGVEVLLDRVADTRQVIEHALALATYNIIDISGGAARPRAISFRHEPQLPLRRYREIFGCEVRFGQPADGFVLTENDLLCPVVESDPQVLEMATVFIEQRYPEVVPPIRTRVRGLVMRHLGSEECSNDRIAAAMCMHPRTLQRRLRSEGSSFELIRDEVRRDMALHCLQQGDMPLTRVAEKLGYAETSVLSRSCYRWFEASPQQLRRATMRGGAAAAE